VEGSLTGLGHLTGLRRLNLARSLVTGSIAALGQCRDLEALLLSETGGVCSCPSAHIPRPSPTNISLPWARQT
jgi:hypothetical protein